MKKIDKKFLFVAGLAITLFLIPFFWLQPGEMDLGGDSHRLYFYDPMANLKAFTLYGVVPWGTGIVLSNQYFLPYVAFLSFLKSFIHSPTILIAIFNGIKLAGSFLFIFLIIRELFSVQNNKKNILGELAAATIGGFIYVFSPAVLDNMSHALITHDLIFLGPLIFYLLLRYILSHSWVYLWIILLLTVIFSSSFALYGPPLYAFFPIIFLFLFLYNFFVIKKSFPWRELLIAGIFFIGLHAFHIIPEISNVFDSGSELHKRAFEGLSKSNTGLAYFDAISQFSKVSPNILMIGTRWPWYVGFSIIPIFMIVGYIVSSRKDKTILLLSTFFLVTLFLKSANITGIGLSFYRMLFLLPGFGMFRNFSGQWQYVFAFFYALLAGVLIATFFSKIKNKYIWLFSFLLIFLLIPHAWGIVTGSVVNTIQRGSKDMKVVIKMDPNYTKMLTYIKKIPNDGKILHIPFTDFAYNLVGGETQGVYVGQSMVSLLAGKNDFAGYQHIDPFSESFVIVAKEKKYEEIKHMLSLLQVRYILHNSDEKVSDTYFPEFPYGYNGVPASSAASLSFVKNISEKLVYKIGTYSLYEVDKDLYLPHVYIPEKIIFYDEKPQYQKQYSTALSFFPTKFDKVNTDKRIAYVDRKSCVQIYSKEICKKESLEQDSANSKVVFQRINPSKYKVRIENDKKPLLFVFQNAYSPEWKIYETNDTFANVVGNEMYFNGMTQELYTNTHIFDPHPFETNNAKIRYESSHIMVNGYANGWYTSPSQNQTYIIEMSGQKKIYYGMGISSITMIIFLLYGAQLYRKKNE